MNENEQLEQEFMKLPTLKHLEMALMQFALELQGTSNLLKDPAGIYCFGFVSFAFTKGQDKY